MLSDIGYGVHKNPHRSMTGGDVGLLGRQTLPDHHDAVGGGVADLDEVGA